MLRTLGYIVAALQCAIPNMSDAVARPYARVISRLAVEHRFDPVTMISMGEFESRWRPHAKNVVGREEYVGILQIRLRNYPECQKSRFTPECDKRRQLLEDWRTNLQTGARYITINRDMCREKVGGALFWQWLFSFQGFNKPKLDIWCGMQRNKRGQWRQLKRPKLVSQVMRERLRIIKELDAKRK